MPSDTPGKARDPRKQPKAGDVLRRASYWNRRVVCVHPDGVVEFQPLRDGEPWGGIEVTGTWEAFAKDAEVIHAAD